jgi:hypothetical protein
MVRGSSLVVHAVHEGRCAGRGILDYLAAGAALPASRAGRRKQAGSTATASDPFPGSAGRCILSRSRG